MSAHVSAVCRSAYGYLWQLRPVTRVLSAEDAKTVVYTFLSSRVDYCNSLLFGISDNLHAPASSGRTKCCSTSCYRYQTSWAHHARFEATSLAASATAHWIQADSFGVQSEWPVSIIFENILPAYLYWRPTTTTIVQRRHVRGSKHSHRSGRSLIHCCWTASVGQPTSPSTWLWTYFPGVLPVTEDALVLLRTAAPI